MLPPSATPPERAVMEDLDPAPAPPARQQVRLEWLLGVLLAIGVLGFAGWDWWRQEQQQTAYAAGVRAQEARQWAAAQAAFREAGDFGDAPERARAAADTIAERDRQYAAAQYAALDNDPLRALAALQAVDRLQPGYGDTPRLLEQAMPQVYRAALDGAVALRPQARPPGLYVYQPPRLEQPGGWRWLPNSDAASQVRAADETGLVIYDGTGGLAGQERALWQATLDGGPPLARRLAFDPTFFQEFRIGPGGIWAMAEASERPFAAEQVQGYSPLRLMHQAPGSDRATTLSWTPRRWVVMDLDRGGPGYLLADMAAAFGDDPRTPLHYVPDTNSNVLYPLYTAPGLVLHARFSPDSRYVLLLTSREGRNAEEIYELVLIDRQAGNSPRVLQTRSINRLIPPNRDLSRPLDATFLTRGPRAGQIAVLTQDGKTSMLSIVDPRDPPAAPRVLWTQPAAPDLKIGLMESSHDAGLSLLWMDRAYPDETFQCIYIDAADHALPLTAPDEQVYMAWAQAEHLIALTAPVNPERGPGSVFRLNVRSLPASALRQAANRFDRAGRPIPAGLSTAPVLYKIHPPSGTPILPVILAPALTAGVEEGDLYAQTYDGAVKLLLEPDVAWLYAPSSTPNPAAFHVLP
jgi:hypothetical protein